MKFTRFEALSLLLAFAALATVTAVLHLWLHLTNPTIASLIYLLIVLITATVSTLWWRLPRQSSRTSA